MVFVVFAAACSGDRRVPRTDKPAVQPVRIFLLVSPETRDGDVQLKYSIHGAPPDGWISVPRTVYELNNKTAKLETAPDGQTKRAVIRLWPGTADFTGTIRIRSVRDGRRRSIKIPIEASFAVESWIVDVPVVPGMVDFRTDPDDYTRVDTCGAAEYRRLELHPRDTDTLTIEYTNLDPFPFDTPPKRTMISGIISVTETRHEDIRRVFDESHESLSANLMFTFEIANQWHWNAIDARLSVALGGRSADFQIPGHNLDEIQLGASVWYRRHLPPVGFLGGLWLTGGVGYRKVHIGISPWYEEEVPKEEQVNVQVISAQGPVYGLGVLWQLELRGETLRGMGGLEYRYTWSNLTTTHVHRDWVPSDSRLDVTGHSIGIRIGWIVGSERTPSGL